MTNPAAPMHDSEPFHEVDVFEDGVWISTMYDGNERPKTGPYETMIFNLDKPEYQENHCVHWRTEELALSGHRKYVWLLSRRGAA